MKREPPERPSLLESESHLSIETLFAPPVETIFEDYARLPAAFPADSVRIDLEDSLSLSVIIDRLIADPRFVILNGRHAGPVYFIPTASAFVFWIRLVDCAMKNGLYVLSKHSALAYFKTFAHLEHVDDEFPLILEHGDEFGFIANSLTPGKIVVPLSRLLRNLEARFRTVMFCQIIRMASRDYCAELLSFGASGWIKELMKECDARTVDCIARRNGLFGEKQQTLEETGRHVHLTRERVRQIEQKFGERVRAHKHYYTKIVNALICEVLGKTSHYVFHEGSWERRFVCRILGLPYARIERTNLLVFGVQEDTWLDIDDLMEKLTKLDTEELARALDGQWALHLGRNEIESLAFSLLDLCTQRFTRQKRVKACLESIGHLAHYSEITECYNALYQDDKLTEKQMQALLSQERNGIVWVGVKGTYALDSWGYFRPTRKLFDATYDIVKRFYAETGRPVPFGLVLAEIGKYRPVVKESSVRMALARNPYLTRVVGFSFVPSETVAVGNSETKIEDVDRILAEFEEELSADEFED